MQTAYDLPPPWFETPDCRCRLFLGDCLDILMRLPDASVDLVFADPPYFLSDGGTTCHAGKRAKVDKGEWDKPLGICEMHDFNLRWLRECQRALKDTGSIWVSGTHHVIFSVGFAMQQLGFKVLSDVIWVKPNPPPNLSCRYFRHASETLIWAAKGPRSRHVFHYDVLRTMAGGQQMKNVWVIPPPARAEKAFGRHATQKPLALLERILVASSSEDALVLDPFLGSGTTAVACLLLGRRFIGVEKEETFAALARARIEASFANASLDLGSSGRSRDEIKRSVDRGRRPRLRGRVRGT